MVDRQLERYWLYAKAYRKGHEQHLASLERLSRLDTGRAGRLAAAFVEEHTPEEKIGS